MAWTCGGMEAWSCEGMEAWRHGEEALRRCTRQQLRAHIDVLAECLLDPEDYSTEEWMQDPKLRCAVKCTVQ